MGSAALLCVLSLLEAVAGIALHDGNIRTAVDAWLSNSAAAEATYGYISTWETRGVTNMALLFCGRSDLSSCNSAAASFNADISAWDTSGVTNMNYMFYEASAFNQDIGGWAVHNVKGMYAMFRSASAFDQDIGGWAVHSVTDMRYMFYEASSFNQDLGWCVDDDVMMNIAFSETPCASTSCGVIQGICDYPMTDNNIRTAVAAWLADATAAEATYGHISTWETGGVTDMAYLLAGCSWNGLCNTAAASFDDDIGAWDTSGVTTMDRMFLGTAAFNQDIGNWAVHSVTSMYNMFRRASSFNQDISGWALDSVTNMRWMIWGASAFDQNLGWCVDDDVDKWGAFMGTLCESTSCGVYEVASGCAPTPAPTISPAPTPAPTTPAPTTPAPTVPPECVRPSGWCTHFGATFTMKDCDGDGLDDPYCSDYTGQSGFRSSKEACEDTWPNGGCGTSSSSGGGGDGDIALIAGAAAAEVLLLVGAFCFYRRRKASMADKAEEASTGQPPPPPSSRFSCAKPEPAASKAEEMYNRIAAWYHEPENAALRAIWGAFPEPEKFQTWSGFVTVTNAFLDREGG